jgi:hypothetical protein
MAKSITVHLEFPIWIVCHPNLKIDEIAQAACKNGQRMTFLFNYENLANDFLNETPSLGGKIVKPILDPWHCFGLLALLQKVGFSHVIFDSAPSPTAESISMSIPMPIGVLLSFVEKASY